MNAVVQLGARSAALLAVALSPSLAGAVDPFEIQVYGPEVNDPGQAALEIHSNFVGDGRTAAPPSELANRHMWRETFEPSVGLAHGFELGGYVQTVRLPQGPYAFAGFKLRAKWRAPQDPHSSVQLAVNAELSAIPTRYDEGRFGCEIRPIIEWRQGPLTVSFNPIVSTSFAGQDALVPVFEPAVRTWWTMAQAVALGIEYYGTFALTRPWRPAQRQDHILFETINLVAWPDWEARVGAGEGLTPQSRGWYLTSIVGHEF